MNDLLRSFVEVVIFPVAGLYVLLTYIRFISNDLGLTVIGFILGIPAFILFLLARSMAYGEEPKTPWQHAKDSLEHKRLALIMVALLGINTNIVLHSAHPVILVIMFPLIYAFCLYISGADKRDEQKDKYYD